MQCLVTRVYYLQEWSSVWGDGLLPWGPVHVPCDPHHQRPPGPRAGLAFAEPARPEPRLLVPRPPAEKKAGLRRQKRLSSTLLSLSRSVQELTEENQSLKEDLDRVLSSSPTVSRTKGYAEWSKPRLLRRIAELEKVSRGLPRSPATFTWSGPAPD